MKLIFRSLRTWPTPFSSRTVLVFRPLFAFVVYYSKYRSSGIANAQREKHTAGLWWQQLTNGTHIASSSLSHLTAAVQPHPPCVHFSPVLECNTTSLCASYVISFELSASRTSLAFLILNGGEMNWTPPLVGLDIKKGEKPTGGRMEEEVWVSDYFTATIYFVVAAGFFLLPSRLHKGKYGQSVSFTSIDSTPVTATPASFFLYLTDSNNHQKKKLL